MPIQSSERRTTRDRTNSKTGTFQNWTLFHPKKLTGKREAISLFPDTIDNLKESSHGQRSWVNEQWNQITERERERDEPSKSESMNKHHICLCKEISELGNLIKNQEICLIGSSTYRLQFSDEISMGSLRKEEFSFMHCCIFIFILHLSNCSDRLLCTDHFRIIQMHTAKRKINELYNMGFKILINQLWLCTYEVPIPIFPLSTFVKQVVCIQINQT